jgi:hypothetical protein
MSAEKLKIGDELGGGRVLYESSFYRSEKRRAPDSIIHYFITIDNKGKYTLYYSLGNGNPINRIYSTKKMKKAYMRLFKEMRYEAKLKFKPHDLRNPWKPQ